MKTKYIFVTGAVEVSNGTAIFASSLARLLMMRGYRVTMLKFDGCLNVDSGLINGSGKEECYVTADGYEGGIDLGFYEWFTGIDMSRANCVTLGKIYQSVINRERRGEYHGKRVQVIPHVTDEIKHSTLSLGSKGNYDFVIVDVCGESGDMNMFPFFEAVNQLEDELGDSCVVLRADTEVDLSEKLIYELPLLMREVGLDDKVLKKMGVQDAPMLSAKVWEDFVDRLKGAEETVTIGVVGKCADERGAYRSIRESMTHATAFCGVKLNLVCISSERLNDGNAEDELSKCDGVIIASDYGLHGAEGKISALKWCRENDMPTLGIGTGMQCMVIEYARNVLGYAEANSTELDRKAVHNVIDLMAEQKTRAYMGGTMRLGSYQCRFTDDSKASKAYNARLVNERHRHSLEVNNAYREQLELSGMRCVGVNPESDLVEVVEVPTKTWYLGVQYHPEYSSTALKANPLSVDYVKAIIENKNNK